MNALVGGTAQNLIVSSLVYNLIVIIVSQICQNRLTTLVILLTTSQMVVKTNSSFPLAKVAGVKNTNINYDVQHTGSTHFVSESCLFYFL